ncbi:MAG: hypothetical protein US42_C0004G0010 [Candidatus Magasanikbacteria bacterium GW2011_GWC2_37_14]|uniref:Uncharacterized protein n=1 Tax=Candidatus Magasanikbacteria bacterium GW2011_GWC2_37_14 TaxID=1619046 RepID=A0A0G0JII0_9BACT|nr:MAG: hypothetical protein US42_C0004G0010 [Candidatus Magasanikbacteria bacterium GW2011_GWC2_37_14]
MDNKKRLIIAILFVILCLGLGYLLYWVFFAKKTPPSNVSTGTTTTTIGKLPTAGEGTITTIADDVTVGLPTAGNLPSTQGFDQTEITSKQVVDSPLIGLNPDKDGQVKFYDQIDGKFYRLDANGKMQALSDEVFYNVQKVTWSKVKNESILEYPDGSNIYYDFDTGKKASLPKHWENFSFSPTGDKIAAKSEGLATENRWLVTSDPDGKNIKLIEPMGDNSSKVTVDWSPNKQIVALSATGEALGDDRQEILMVGLNKENFPSIIVEGRGLKSSWSPTGKKLLYSVYSARNDYKPEIWVVDAEGDNIGSNRRLLSVNTWVDKCTFADERYAYCAVPIALQTGAGFAPALANGTPDQIFKIDLESGVKIEVPLNENHTIDSLNLSPDGTTLYFTDKNQTGLFNLSL